MRLVVVALFAVTLVGITYAQAPARQEPGHLLGRALAFLALSRADFCNPLRQRNLETVRRSGRVVEIRQRLRFGPAPGSPSP